MRGRNLSGIEKLLRPAFGVNENGDQPAEDRQQRHDESRAPPWVKLSVVTEIAFVTLGNLLLRARGFRHRLSI